MLEMKKLLIVIGVIVLVAAAGVGGYLLNNKKPQAAPIANATASSQVATCKAGASQTLGNAAYVVGTDITPGNYKVTSQAAGRGWTDVGVYDSKSDYAKAEDPNNQQHINNNSFQTYNQSNTLDEAAAPTYTKLSDGQYMVVSSDPAVFTCQ